MRKLAVAAFALAAVSVVLMFLVYGSHRTPDSRRFAAPAPPILPTHERRIHAPQVGAEGRSRLRPSSDDESAGPLTEPELNHEELILEALAGQHSNREERATLRTALETSGQSNAAWTLSARSTIADWAAAIGSIEGEGAFRVERVECYAAGCILDMTFAEPAAHRIALDHADKFFPRRWRGMRVFTGAENTGSALLGSLVLVAPR